MTNKIKKVIKRARRVVEPALPDFKKILKKIFGGASGSPHKNSNPGQNGHKKNLNGEQMTSEEFENYLLQRGVWVQSDTD